MSFRTRMVLFFVIIVVIPVVAVGLVLSSLTGDSSVGRADSQLAEALTVAIAVFEESREQAVDDLDRVTRDEDLRAAFTARGGDGVGDVQEVAERIVRADEAIESMLVYDDEGEQVAAAGDEDALAYATAAPREPGGRQVGRLALSTTTADEYVSEVTRLTGLEARVVRDGARVATTLEESGEAEPLDTTLEAGGGEYRGRYVPAGEAVGEPAQLGVFQDAERLSSEIGGDRLLVAEILLGFFLLAVVSSVLVVHSLGHQIARFLGAARAVGRGDFEARVPAEGGDEFAALGREFNAMSRQLKDNIDELERRRREREEAIRRIGDAFAAGLDRSGIATLAARTAVEACQADAGYATRGELGAATPETVGRDDPVLSEALEQAERGARSNPDEPSVVAHGEAHALGAMLRGGPRPDGHRDTLGYISIARLGAPFDDAELGLFVYLSAQASISLDNAGLHAAVQEQALTDPLTGLNNRRHFDSALETEIGRSRRFGGDVGLLMLDLDSFKPINDRYGHQEGDRVLVELAILLRRLTRDVDQLARYGGDEITIILPQTDLAGAELLAERVRAGIEALTVPSEVASAQLSVTASLGVASLPDCANDRDSLVRAADAALYRAKRAGGNRVGRASPAVVSR